jgi:hypothetical protein
MNIRELRHALMELEKVWDSRLGEFQDQRVCIYFYLGSGTEELENIDIDSYSAYDVDLIDKESESTVRKSRKFIALS